MGTQWIEEIKVVGHQSEIITWSATMWPAFRWEQVRMNGDVRHPGGS